MILSKFFQVLAAAVLASLVILLCPSALAQGPVPEAPSIEGAPPIAVQSDTHLERRFWDRENKLLFAGVAASHAADFAVTYTNLQSGGQELNPLVRVFGKSAAGLAANFAGETLSTVTLAYVFHKTHHSRLERSVSMVDISLSTGAVAYGLKHR